MFDVARTIFRVREEVKDGAVVPEINGHHAPHASNVRLDPRNRRVGKSRPRTAERRSGNVKDRQALNTAIDQPIHETGIPAPNVDHSTAAGEAGSVEQPQRRCGICLKPTDFGRALRQVEMLPMLLAIHVRGSYRQAGGGRIA